MSSIHSTVEAMRIALSALRANTARGVLTTLGIIIGILAVVTTMTAANGLSNSFRESASVIGADVLFVSRTPWIVMGRFFQFRNWYDYSGGVAGDEYVHLLSRVHYVLGVQYPQSAVSNGGIYKWTGDRDVPDLHNTMYDYGKFQAVVNANLVCNWDGGHRATGVPRPRESLDP